MDEFDIVGALTTVTDAFGRVSMHGVREELLRAQLDAAGLPAVTVRIPYPCPNEIYEREMAAAVAAAKARGVTHIIFGDLYLEDIRAYREAKLADSGITPVFPLWQRPTAVLARAMIDAGVEAHLAVVDLKKLSASFAGRRFDAALLDALPAGADPCGENGEFHSFVSAGPMLSRKIAVSVGETVERDGFAFARSAGGQSILSVGDGPARAERAKGGPGPLTRSPRSRSHYRGGNGRRIVPLNTPPVRFETSATMRWPSASISASVMVLSRGCMVTAMAIDFLPGSMPLPS